MAGGAPVWRSTQLSYYDTPNAKQGDLGSKVLPPNPTGVVWKAGETVEAKWSVRANVIAPSHLAFSFLLLLGTLVGAEFTDLLTVMLAMTQCVQHGGGCAWITPCSISPSLALSVN